MYVYISYLSILLYTLLMLDYLSIEKFFLPQINYSNKHLERVIVTLAT